MGRKSVDVVHDKAGWTVEVVEYGNAYSRSFAVEAFAKSYADGQRERLKLRLSDPVSDQAVIHR